MAGLDLEALVTAQRTDVGLVRASNQDHCGEFRHPSLDRRLLVVADGMGGHQGGEVASQLAVEVVGEAFQASTGPVDQVLRDAFEAANARIYERSTGDRALSGMGTTAVALVVSGEPGPPSCWVASVGDSRAYRLHAGRLELVTRDHSVVGELVRRGHISEEEARHHPRRNEILRALGTQPDVETDLFAIDPDGGDHFILCSDGLSGMLLDDEIAQVVEKESPETAAGQLVEMANECGGTDNITVQIARIPSIAETAAGAAREDAGDTPENRRRWALALIAIVGFIWLLVRQL